MNKKMIPHIIAAGAFAVFIVLGLASASTGKARETIPKTAVTLQRVRSTIMSDLPMQIFVDDNPHEIANGASITILVNNGEHMVYAVLGEVESKSVRFTAKSQTLTVNVTPKEKLLGLAGTDLTIEVK
jgi:hypothetical protein